MIERENIGHVLIGFVCCVWPLLWAGIGIVIYRRIQSRGLGSFIPRIRR